MERLSPCAEFGELLFYAAMTSPIQAVRGMNDILSDQCSYWQAVESRIYDTLARYGYQEIRLPVVERTELFVRSIGEATDIVEKEMYTFVDRNGDSLTLRPEGTAGCVRAVLEHGLLHQQPNQRLWYGGLMFRHERPQKGRYRQFRQIGAETFGMSGPDVDAELILMCARLWRGLGLADLKLEINSLGSPEARATYRQELVTYLRRHFDALDEDSRRRLETNPLRVLDSKNPDMQDLIEAAPRLWDHLDGESQRHFEQLCGLLQEADVGYRVNYRLVRGLDYYTRTVFEWVSDRLGAQGTVCAGGRYDGLVEQMGGRPTPAAGFAVGLERLVALARETPGFPPQATEPHAYLVRVGASAEKIATRLAERLRDRVPELRLVVDCSGGGFKGQLRRADKSGAYVAIVLGEDEARSGDVGFKHLRIERPQQTFSEERVVAELAALVGSLGDGSVR